MSTRRNIPTGRLTARSVLLSVLLGSDPPRLPVRLLVRTTDLFGIAEGTTRTALSRMTAVGELTSTQGVYELTSPSLLARQVRQTSSRVGHTTPWDGEWHQAIIGLEGRRSADDRSAIRSALLAARFAERREGIWLRPANLQDPIDSLARQQLDDGVEWFRSRPVTEPKELASRLWDLERWSTEASALRTAMARLTGPLERGDRTHLAEGFVLSAAVLRHFQSDPLLPPELLGSGWPGSALRVEYDRYDRAYRDVLRGWFAEQG